MSSPQNQCPICTDWFGRILNADMERHYWWHRLELLEKETIKAAFFAHMPSKPEGGTDMIDEIFKDLWTVYYNKGLADDYYIAELEAKAQIEAHYIEKAAVLKAIGEPKPNILSSNPYSYGWNDHRTQALKELGLDNATD